MQPKRTETERLCGRAEELCHEIASRELGGAALYIVPRSRLPENLGRTAVRDGDQAKDELWRTCSDPALLAQWEDRNEGLNAALSRRTELQTRIRDLRNWSERDLMKAVHAFYPSKAEQLRERPEDRAARADEHQAELAKLEKMITDVEQR